MFSSPNFGTSVPLYLRLLTLLGLAVLASLASASPPKAEEVYPGIWRIRLGSPEKLTPLTYRSASVKISGLSALPPVRELPISDLKFARSARGCTVQLPMEDGEKFYGLGLSTNTFELSGRKAWSIPSDHPEEPTNESHAPEPFYVSSRGYALYVDTARYAAFSFGDFAGQSVGKHVLVDIPAASGIDVYVFAGPTALQAVQRYELFSGGGPVPPLWGLGIAYRGKGDSTADDILKLASSFRKDDLPCDIFGVEPGWQTHTYSCSFLWNLLKFPDPDGFIRQMHAMNYRMSFWEHPFTHPSSPIYAALKPFAGDQVVWGGLVPDFATPQARKIYVGMQTESLFFKGVDSVKIDEVDAQPFKPDPWSFPDFTQFPSGLDGEQMHSLFGVLAQQTMAAPYQGKKLRTWGLVRNSGALATSLPYTVYSDSYDHASYLRGLVKSGFGSHLWTPEVRDAKSVADLVRRVQTVILSPYAMINCWYMKMPPWLQINAEKSNAGEAMPEAAEATALIRKAFQLRMSLLPYLYSAFIDYHQTGMPPIRALALDFPDDPHVARLDDQFMLGPSLMAAPFIDGQSTRKVYLPAGEWFDFFTGERISGGRTVEVTKPLGEFPLYVRSGTILPLAEPTSHVGTGTVFKLHIRVYGDHPAPFTLYEDDGESLDFQQGLQSQLHLSWNGTGTASRTGKFNGHRFEIVDWDVVGK